MWIYGLSVFLGLVGVAGVAAVLRNRGRGGLRAAASPPADGARRLVVTRIGAVILGLAGMAGMGASPASASLRRRTAAADDEFDIDVRLSHKGPRIAQEDSGSDCCTGSCPPSCVPTCTESCGGSCGDSCTPTCHNTCPDSCMGTCGGASCSPTSCGSTCGFDTCGCPPPPPPS